VTLSLAVVCEASADQQTGCGLADRVFLAEVAWLEEEMLPHCRQWRGLNPQEPCLLWKNVHTLARKHGIRAHGHFDGEPGAPDAHCARLALLLLHTTDHAADAIVLLRDDDRKTGRRKGLEQARSTSRMAVPIVIGLAHPKRECWVLAGFEPRDRAEQRRLTELTKELGFDPRHHAQRLNAKQAGQKRNAKRVLDELTGGEWERQAACWRETDLQRLRARGGNIGLAVYLDAVNDRLVPLISGQAAAS